MAPVATVLGLLLVVTVLANYLTTTLPNQMAANDLSHEVLVENQLGNLQALLGSVAGTGVPGAPALGPISLGSVGVPPFAAPDGSTVSSIPGEVPASISFGAVSTHYAPPTGWVQNGSAPACSLSPPPPNTNSITCTGSSKSNIWYNFAGSTNYTFKIQGNGQVSFVLNFSSNRSSISVSAAGGAYNLIQIVGSYDNVNVSGTGGANLNVTVVGNYDSATIGDTGGGTVNVLIVGNHDTVAISNLGQSHTFVAGWGSYDFVSPTKNGGPYTVYFTGFDPDHPATPICPYGTAGLTDNVTGPAPSGSKVTFNNTVLNNTKNPKTNYPYAGWTTIYNVPTPGVCIFFPRATAGGADAFAASLLVRMQNTYAPAAEAAYDQGAVIYVQPGGYPVVVDPPALTFNQGLATVFLPAFLNQPRTESGLGTAAAVLHLVSTAGYTFPGLGWVLDPSHPLRITLVTPYAYAWVEYFAGISSFVGHVSCTPATSVGCTGPYEDGNPLATVTFVLPATAISLELGVFSISLR